MKTGTRQYWEIPVEDSFPTYHSWWDMRRRCLDENYSQYVNYGARGISICKEWVHDYDAFVRDMGFASTGRMLERLDNNGNYNRENCRWVNSTEQNNNKRNNRFLTYAGKTQNATKWAQQLGIPRATIYSRIRRLGVENTLVDSFMNQFELL